MSCPICAKKFQRLKPHLRSKRGCSESIDFEMFIVSFDAFDRDFKKERRNRMIEKESLKLQRQII